MECMFFFQIKNDVNQIHPQECSMLLHAVDWFQLILPRNRILGMFHVCIVLDTTRYLHLYTLIQFGAIKNVR